MGHFLCARAYSRFFFPRTEPHLLLNVYTHAGRDEDEADSGDDDKPEIEQARTVYHFLHTGGPNTPSMIRPQYLPDSRRMVFITEQSGFRHLHVLDPLYESLDQLTRGRHEAALGTTRKHTVLLVLNLFFILLIQCVGVYML